MKSKWNIVPLRNLIGFISKGIAPAYAEDETETTIRVLNQKCNRNFQISYSESRLHDVSKKRVPSERYVKQNDIIINSTGTGTAGRIAQINYVPCETTVDGHMIIIRANEKVTQRYLGCALKAHQRKVMQLDEGSTGQTELNRERLLEEIMISYPESFDEQEKIVALLDSLDNKIRQNIKINDNLAELLQALYQQQFCCSNCTDNQGRLADLCDYSKAKVAVTELSLSTYYSTENMLPGKAGAVDAANLPTTTQVIKCQIGDVLISNIRPYFKKIVYCHSNCGCSMDVLCFTPKLSQLSAYLYSVLYADSFFDFMVAGSKGTKMPRGDKQQIMTYAVHIPTKEEIKVFNALAMPILEQIENTHRENMRLSSLRDSLLPKLMSGELDVSELDI